MAKLGGKPRVRGAAAAKTAARGGAPVFNRERRKKILWVDLVVKSKKARGFSGRKKT